MTTVFYLHQAQRRVKIYGISGLGADKSVFQYLSLDCPLIPIDWIHPHPNEPLAAYALRLAQAIDTSEDYGILGVSFGGLMAVEMSKMLKPRLTVLVSSAETKRELRPIYRLIGKLGIINVIPYHLLDPPRWLAYFLFGTKKKKLLDQILFNTDLRFAKWAVRELLIWDNTTKLENALKISGTHDKLIPPKDSENTVLIEQGEHFMIVDKAEQISRLINEKLKTLKTTTHQTS